MVIALSYSSWFGFLHNRTYRIVGGHYIVIAIAIPMRTILEHKITRLLYRTWFLTDLADLFCLVRASKTISYTGWQVDGLGPQRL